MTITDVASREKQVAKYQSELVSACEALHKAIESLAIRLEQVVTAEPVSGQAEQKNPIPVLVPLAEFLRVRTVQINSAVEKIEQLKNRLEI